LVPQKLESHVTIDFPSVARFASTRTDAPLPGRHTSPSPRNMTLRTARWLVSAILLLSATASAIGAQDTARTAARDSAGTAPRDSVVEVRLRDGSVLYGRVLLQDSVHVVLRTLGGTEVDVKRELITSFRMTRGRQVGDAYWAADPNGTRLFFTATGRALGRGEGYVSTYFLFFPFVAYGVTDHFTIAGGTPILPGAIGRAFYLAPKFTVRETTRSSYAVGALSFALTEDIAEGTFGLLYGVGTWGDRDNAFTAGAGWGYSWGKKSSSVSSSPVVVLGGETRVGRRVKLVTENWLFTGSDANGGLFSGGFRFIGDRLSSDLGLIGGAGTGAVACCLPMVNFVWNFGRNSK
jgi:hypothetical protein